MYEVGAINLVRRTSTKTAEHPRDLLEELATCRGLRWGEIARLCGVTVSAVREWRSGQAVSADCHRAQARLAAFLELLKEVGLIEEPAGWLLMRLGDQLDLTAADLYIKGQADDLLEYAGGYKSLEELLESSKPSEQIVSGSDWQVVNWPDGERVLTRRCSWSLVDPTRRA